MRSALAALALLLAITGFCLWNSRSMSARSASWQSDLQKTAQLIQEDRWQEAQALLRASHRDWEAGQGYLRTVSSHAVLEEAEELYRRSLAYAEVRNPTLLLAVLAHLDDQLQLLSDREGLSLTNIF